MPPDHSGPELLPIEKMEPLYIEDAPSRAIKTTSTMLSFSAIKPALISAFVVVLCLFLVALALKRDEKERRAHVITYSNNIKGAGSATAVEWRFNMPDGRTMEKVSRDGSLGSTSTAFVTRRSEGEWDVMFYSKGGTRYVFSGHSIQGASYTLFQAFDEDPSRPIILHTPGYQPIVTTIDDEHRVIQEIDTEDKIKFFCRPLKEVVHRLDESIAEEIIDKFKNDVLESLGIASESLADLEENIWVFHLGIVVIVNSEETLKTGLSPNWEKMKELKVPGDTEKGWIYNPRSAFTHTRNVVVAVLLGLEDPVNFKYRFFCPRLGINEDPVTGTGMNAMVSLYAQIKDKKDTWFTAEQCSHSPGSLKGIWEPDGKAGIIRSSGAGTIQSINSLPLKYRPEQPY